MPAARSLLAVLLAAVAASVLPAAALAEPAGAPGGGTGDYLDLGADHACALQSDRVVRCFGRGGSGRLGHGAMSNLLELPGQQASSVAVRGARQVVAGDAHSCLLTEAGVVRCWGQGATGQLGGRTRDNRGDGHADPLTGTDELTTVPLGGPAVQLSAGGSFTCAIVVSGAVRCWGEGLGGRLGSGAEDSRLDGLDEGAGDEASTVPLAGAATAISAGDQHACALVPGGAVQCWGVGGSGRLGQLGTDSRLDGAANGSGTDGAATVPLGAAATAIAAGGEHSCALLADGRVRCWGENSSGQLGSGGTDDKLDQTGTGGDVASTVPLRAAGAANNAAPVPAVAITAGDNHTCAVMQQPAGELRCWGGGAFGQLGTGQTTNRLSSSSTNLANAASRVALGAAVIGVSAGGATTCAQLAGGAVRCFGDGAFGAHGGGAADPRLDGVIDPATGTDEPTLVTLGPLPASREALAPLPPELPGQPVPVPAPAVGGGPAPAAGSSAHSAPPAAALRWTVKLKGKRATVAALLLPAKGGRCPKRVTAELRLGKRRLAKATLRTKPTGAHCRAAGTLRLRSTVPKRKTATLKLSAKGVQRRTLAVRG